MNHPKTPTPPSLQKKWIYVLVTVLVTASVSGYFMGLRQLASMISSRPEADHSYQSAIPQPGPAPVPVIVDYSLLPLNNYKANADWENALDNLLQPEPQPPPSVPPTPEERLLALQTRANLRAFEGAPPLIPHSIDQLSSASCLACHAQGAVIKDRVAAKISHPHWSSCTQCHLPANNPMIPSPDLTLLRAALAENQFTGWTPSVPERAYANSPPIIPHAVWKRQDCRGCHGSTGPVGLRTTHPDRQNCLQCHAASQVHEPFPFIPELFHTFNSADHAAGGTAPHSP